MTGTDPRTDTDLTLLGDTAELDAAPAADPKSVWREVTPDWAARVCDAAHGSELAAEAGHREGFCLACAELRRAMSAVPQADDPAPAEPQAPALEGMVRRFLEIEHTTLLERSGLLAQLHALLPANPEPARTRTSTMHPVSGVIAAAAAADDAEQSTKRVQAEPVCPTCKGRGWVWTEGAWHHRTYCPEGCEPESDLPERPPKCPVCEDHPTWDGKGWVLCADHPTDHAESVGDLPPARPTCPDGGTCHHQCAARCWRVDHAGPLSGVYPDDRWPTRVGDLSGDTGSEP